MSLTLKHKAIPGNAIRKFRDPQGPEDGVWKVALPTLALSSQAEAYYHHHDLLGLQWATLGRASGEEPGCCPLSRDPRPSVSPGHVPKSSTIYTPARPSPRTIPQVVFVTVSCSFSKPYCLLSFSQTQLLIIVIIIWQRFTTWPPSYKKQKINLIPGCLSLGKPPYFEGCFLVQSPLC